MHALTVKMDEMLAEPRRNAEENQVAALQLTKSEFPISCSKLLFCDIIVQDIGSGQV